MLRGGGGRRWVGQELHAKQWEDVVSLPHETVLELMSLADGELEGEAREHAEKLIAESDEARRVVEAMRGPHVGIWLKDAIDRRADAAGVDGIAETVMARLAPQAKEVRVVPIGG